MGAANAFQRNFLRVLDERDEPSSSGEADYDGPWAVLPCRRQGAGGFGVFRHHERPPADRPEAWFLHREHALLAVAMMPALARDPHYRLATEDEGEGDGYLVRQDGEAIGWFATFNEPLAESMHAGECLLRSPASLASLLLALSTNAFRLVGRILAARAPEELPRTTRGGTGTGPQGELP